MSEDRIRQEVRKVLRSEEEGLSPGFYARTVARFEADRRRLPFGLTWSTAGLAAATLAAALIFVPMALRDELPQPEPVRVQDQESRPTMEQPAPPPVERLDALGRIAEDKRQEAKQVLATTEVEEPAEVEESIEEFAPSPGRDERREKAEEADLDDAVGDLVADEQEVFDAPAPAEPRAKESAAGAETPVSEGLRASRTVAVELPAGSVPIGEIEIRDPSPARDLYAAPMKKGRSESSAGALMQTQAKAAPATRFVAIGPRPGLDSCSALELRRTADAWEIDYEESGSSTGAVACGIAVPDDGLEIRFQGWRIDE